jgi:excinuclease ABC subunit A
LPWNAHPYYTLLLETVCRDIGIDIHTPYEKLSQKHKDIVLYGTPGTFTMAYVGKYEE